MATTNLISKSLGDIFLETGNGTPDHTSPKGSLYVDQDTAKVYQNSDGSTSWQVYQTVAYGEAYYQGNTTATVINTTNTWTLVDNTFILGDVVGVTSSGATISILPGYDGEYEVRGDLTISYVAGTNNYEVGLSVNDLNPSTGSYNGALIDVTYTRQHIGFETIVSMTSSTSLKLSVRNLTNTDNVIIRNSQVFLRKIE